MFYKTILKPIFFRIHPEHMHALVLVLGEVCGALPPVRWVLSRIYGYRGPDIAKVVDCVRYERPVLLSAGFDCDARLTRVLGSLSFGGEEVGSVTALPCEGNPKPRQTRLIRNKSLIIFKGLRNQGAVKTIKKLLRTKRAPGYVVGISIAATNSAAVSTDEAALQDYLDTYRKMNEAGVGDYYTINISCPNSFCGKDGETFASPRLLPKLIAGMQQIPTTKPVYFKMPINLAWPEFDELLQIIDKSPYQGVIIGNLNKDYSQLDHPEDAPKVYRGGLSGKPCFAISNDLIARTRQAYGKRFTIIGVGGIFSGQDALAKFRAGADLVQLITGMVFEGPGLMKEVCQAYAGEYGALQK